MAEIVNLRQARKRKARLVGEKAAERNRIVHGRTKTEHEAERLLAQKAELFLEGHRRPPRESE
jgi:hypothetical protein